MRVFHICESYSGGVKRHLDLISEYMDKNVDNYFYISPIRNETIEIKSKNIFVDEGLSDRRNTLNLLKSTVNIIKVIKDIKPQVIHFHSTFAGIIACLIKPFIKKQNIKFIYTPHAYFSQKELSSVKRFIVTTLEKLILKKMDKIIHVSLQEEKHCFEKGLLKKDYKDKSIVIYNGVVQNGLKKFERNDKKTTFISVARCVEQKNPNLFVEIARNYLEKNSDAEFVFVGDGPNLEGIKTFLDKEGLSEKIKFVGHSNEVEAKLIKADYYISTSLYEGMPYSVIEAMSLGLPLILSNVIGHEELIENNGYLYMLNDVEFVVDLLLSLSNLDSKGYKKLSEKSYEKFTKEFNAKINIDKLVKVYQLQEQYEITFLEGGI